ncbi:unnamed protein product [Rotaria sordida]|uniref:Uncharacterized protein n=2 Tax=Rotaria sordida TaxID=392033 RepID=A0A815QLB3_9BILA|nr:unnamed protein product [Rotaria sordida]
MEATIGRMLQKLVVMDDCSQLVKDIVINGTLDFTVMITTIFNNLDKLNKEKKMYFSKFIAEYSTTKKFLSGLQKQVIDDDSNAKKIFMKKILDHIQELILKADEDIDVIFVINYAILCNKMISCVIMQHFSET